MSGHSGSSPALGQSQARGRGRDRSRGGLGKYLRARGKGRGPGRPAEFGNRLLLEGEGPDEEDEDGEAAAEQAKKYSRREMGTNVDRYIEPEPELDSEGEEIVEPEVDLSTFLERQRLSDVQASSLLALSDAKDDEEVDHSLAHISSRAGASTQLPRKGQMQSINWDDELEQMSREKSAAEAARDLKSRFRANSNGSGQREQRHQKKLVKVSPLPSESTSTVTATKDEMQNFLDDLLG